LRKARTTKGGERLQERATLGKGRGPRSKKDTTKVLIGQSLEKLLFETPGIFLGVCGGEHCSGSKKFREAKPSLRNQGSRLEEINGVSRKGEQELALNGGRKRPERPQLSGAASAWNHQKERAIFYEKTLLEGGGGLRKKSRLFVKD